VSHLDSGVTFFKINIYFSAGANYHEEGCYPRSVLPIPSHLDCLHDSLYHCFDSSNSCTTSHYNICILYTHCTAPITYTLFSLRYHNANYSVLSLSIAEPRFDLSGRTAAMSSIFLNCHGKREGYRKGRKSNPDNLHEANCISYHAW
jgi:hypothetical protein